MRKSDLFAARTSVLAFVLAISAGGVASGQVATVRATEEMGNTHPQYLADLSQPGAMSTLRLVLHPSTHTVTVAEGGYQQRDNCPAAVTYAATAFTGGTYIIQAGMGEGESAAVSYTLSGSLFPAHITLMECIFAQLNASVQTTTQYSVIIYDGFPTSPQPQGFPIIYSSSTDPGDAPPLIMAPGTRGTNIQVSIDPQDIEQIYIYNPTGAATHSFTVAFRIDHHNAQTADSCFLAPPVNMNAFVATDGTVQPDCGIGYGQLNYPNENWLGALNCGPNGCPPNGGWARFNNLQAEQLFLGFCLSPGCRPHSDWMMRVTYDPVNCPPPDGACCFGTAGCAVMTQVACAGTGSGVWRGPGTTCGTFSGGAWSGCVAPPNQPPVANAGADQTVNDNDHNGAETVIVNGDLSSDPDGFIAAYRWSEGATVIQDGPSFLSHSFPVGSHTLTLRVTDNQGAIATDTMTVTVVAPCVADFDNGTGTGTPDGGVGIEDLLYYLLIYDEGSVAADVDDGTATGVRDGGVGIEDLLYYLTRYDAGC